MFKYFEHTADVGIRVTGDSLNALFEDAARALFALIVNELDSVKTTSARQFELTATDHDMLLRDWLAELLYAFDAEGMLFSRFEIAIHENSLSATAHGELYDEVRHELQCEVKAVTYHGLAVEKAGNGWQAEVIVDI
jgi:SHS2 domain-containing protein